MQPVILLSYLRITELSCWPAIMNARCADIDPTLYSSSIQYATSATSLTALAVSSAVQAKTASIQWAARSADDPYQLEQDAHRAEQLLQRR